MCGAKAWMMLTAPNRLTAKTCCQASGVDVSTLLLPGPLMPALLNLLRGLVRVGVGG